MSSNNSRNHQSINEVVATAAISALLSNPSSTRHYFHHQHSQHEFYYDEQHHTNIPHQYYVYTFIQQIMEWIRHLLRLFLILCTMLLTSLVIYVIVYNAVIPEIISKPIYFDYNYQHCRGSSGGRSSRSYNYHDGSNSNLQGGLPCPPTAIIHLPSIHTQWEAHSPHVAPKTSSSSFVLPIISSSPRLSSSSSKITSKQRPYFIHIKLSLPSSHQNQQIGNFMIETYIQNSNRTTLATSKRPVIIPYQSEYVSQWTNFFNLFFFFIGMKDENHILKIECFDHFMNGGGGGGMGSGYGTSSSSGSGSSTGRHYQYGMHSGRSINIGQQWGMLGYYLSSNEAATATDDDIIDNHHYQQDNDHYEDDKDEEFDTFMSYIEIRLLVPPSIHTNGVTSSFQPTTMSTYESYVPKTKRRCHDYNVNVDDQSHFSHTCSSTSTSSDTKSRGDDEKNTHSSQINEERKRNLNIHNHIHQYHHHYPSTNNDHHSSTSIMHTSIQITKAELQIGQELNRIQRFMTNWFYTSAFSFIFLTMIWQFLIYIFVKLIWKFRLWNSTFQQRQKQQSQYYDYPSKDPGTTVYDDVNDDLNESDEYINMEDLNETNERSSGTSNVKNEAFDEESSDQWVAFDDNEKDPSGGNTSEHEENQQKSCKQNDVQEQEGKAADSKECSTECDSRQDCQNLGKTVSSTKKKVHESKLSHNKAELKTNANKAMTSSERQKVDKVMREDWEPYEIFTGM